MIENQGYLQVERRTIKPATALAQALGWVDPTSDSLGPAIEPSTSFLRDPSDLGRAGRMFTRDDNPSFLRPEALLAALEGGEGSLLFSSGMAAATAVMQLLSPGDHVMVPAQLYSGLRHWLNTHGTRWGLRITAFDYDDLAGLRTVLAADPAALVWLETPANPLWHVTDIAAVAMFLWGQKYLNGHADVVAGALVAAPGSQALLKRLSGIRNDYGSVLGPFEAWLMLRGMRTLSVRMEAICRNAMEVARFLAGNAAVVEVIYPGLETHPQHGLAARQMEGGFGGMISFRPRGGERAAHRIASATRVIRQAISFGGLESVIEIRRGMEGPLSTTPPDLLRLSIGIESTGDLVADLSQALSA